MSEGAFPTLGVRFDLTSIAQWDAALAASEKQTLDYGQAHQKAAGQIVDAQGKVATSVKGASDAQKASVAGAVKVLDDYVGKLEQVVATARAMAGKASLLNPQSEEQAAAQIKAIQRALITTQVEAAKAGQAAISAAAAQGADARLQIDLAAIAKRSAAENEYANLINRVQTAATADGIALAKQREAALIESQARIDAAVAQANAFALDSFQSTTASMIALARQREAALSAAAASAYGRAEQDARRTNTPFSVIATGQTVDPAGKFLGDLGKMDEAGGKLSAYQAALKEIEARELGVAEAAAPMIAALRATGEAASSTGGKLHAAGGQAYTFRELLVSLREVMRGDFTRLGGTLLILGQQFGIITTAVTVFAFAIGIPIAILGAFYALLDSGVVKLDKFNNAMKATGDYAGISFGQFQQQSEKIAEATNNATGSIEKTMQAVVATGKVSGQAISDTTAAATRLADLSGQKSEAVAKQLTGMYGDSANGALKLNESVHFLTNGLYGQIKAAEDAGDSAKAFDLAMKGLNDELETRGNPQMGGLNGLIHNLHLGLDDVINDFERWGRLLDGVSSGLDKVTDAAAGLARHPANEGVLGTLSHLIPTKDNLQASLDEFMGHNRAYYLQEQAVGRSQMTGEAETAAQKAARVRQQDLALRGLVNSQSMEGRLRAGDPILIQKKQDDFWAANAAALSDPTTTPKDRARLKWLKAHQAQVNEDIRKQNTRSAGRGGSTAGVQNQLAALQARAAGLTDQALNPATDPVSAALDQIKTAGDQAAGGASFGKRSAFQSQLADAASDVKRLELIKQINTALNKQVETEQRRRAEEQAAFAAYQQGAQAQQDFYKAGDVSIEAQIKLQQQLIDIQAQAKEKADAIREIQATVGATDPTTGAAITTMDQAYPRLLALAGGNHQLADAMRDRLQADVDATQATDKQVAANDKARAALDPLIAAQRAYAEELQHTRDLKTTAGLATADERAAQALVTQEGIYRVIAEAQAQGVVLTHQQAENIERANQLLQVQQQYWADLAIQMKDAMENAFVDTGKLDFKGLEDSVKRALRKAVYDELIAKPINIVIDATVSMIQQVENAFLKPLGDQITNALGGGFNAGDLGGLFGGTGVAANDNTSSAISFFANTGAGSLGGSLNSVSDSMGTAAKSLKTLTQPGAGGISSSIVQGLGTALAGAAIGAAIGNPIAKALGINQGAGATVGALGGAAIGAAFGGPIGAAIGGAIGDLIGGLFDNKPTNGAAFAKLTPNSAFYSTNAKTSSQSAQLAATFGQTVVSDEQIFKAAGIKTSAYVSGVDIGTRDVPNVSFSDGTTKRLGQVGDAAAAAAAAMKELLQSATYASDAQKQFVQAMINAGDTLDTLSQKLQEYGQANALLKGVDRAILKIQDPLGGALADLQDQQIARRQQAIAYYQDGVMSAADLTKLQTQLKTLESLEINQTIGQFNTGLTEVVATLADFQAAQVKIIDYAKGLLTNTALSPLSAQDQLSTAASAFQSMLSKAQGGDKTSLEGITGAADTYLNQAHSFYASSAGYASIFAQVQTALQALGTQSYPGATAAVDTAGDTPAGALAALQAAITQQNADLITAISPANSNAATSTDIAGQTATLVTSLAAVQTTIAASTEAIVGAVGGSGAASPAALSTLLAGGIAA